MQTQMPKIRLMQSLGLGLLRRVIPHDEIPPIKHHRAMMQWFQSAIDAGHIKHESADDLATIFMGAMIAHVHIAEFSRSEQTTTQDYAKMVAKTLIHGLSPQKESPICS